MKNVQIENPIISQERFDQFIQNLGVRLPTHYFIERTPTGHGIQVLRDRKGETFWFRFLHIEIISAYIFKCKEEELIQDILDGIKGLNITKEQ